jgi:hypothetical protein
VQQVLSPVPGKEGGIRPEYGYTFALEEQDWSQEQNERGRPRCAFADVGHSRILHPDQFPRERVRIHLSLPTQKKNRIGGW